MSDIEKNTIHPSHYNKEGRKECWEEQEHAYGTFAVVCFDICNAHKYMYRAGEKEGNPKEQDIAKIKNYIAHANKLTETLNTPEKIQAHTMLRTLERYLEREGIDNE